MCNFRTNNGAISEHLIGIHLSTNVGEKNGSPVHHGMLLTSKKVMWIRNMISGDAASSPPITISVPKQQNKNFLLRTKSSSPGMPIVSQHPPMAKSNSNKSSISHFFFFKWPASIFILQKGNLPY